jgi:Kef-type K+ transport system membrane component KefB
MPQTANGFVLELFVIFVWAKVFAEVFEQLSLPAALGEILAGVVLGPYASRLIVPSVTTHSMAEMGAIFLLFGVGLETQPADLIRVGRQALGVALAGVAVPFILGFGYTFWRGLSLHESTFVAAAMVATSVGITARVLNDMGVIASRSARIILGAAVFDDIFGMLILAVVVGLASAAGVQWIQLGVLTSEAVAFALFMIFIAPRVIQRIRPRIEGISLPDAPLIFALAICLGLSVVAEKIGIAGIIGAFFAGLAFAEYGPEWHINSAVRGITEFLTPFFFFTIGARLDLSVFSPSILGFSVVLSVLAIFSKVLGCGLPLVKGGMAADASGWDRHDTSGRSSFHRGPAWTTNADALSVDLRDCDIHDRCYDSALAATTSICVPGCSRTLNCPVSSIRFSQGTSLASGFENNSWSRLLRPTGLDIGTSSG